MMGTRQRLWRGGTSCFHLLLPWYLLALSVHPAAAQLPPALQGDNALFDVSQLFPGLGDLRRAQEMKLRELLSPSNPAWTRGTPPPAPFIPDWNRGTTLPASSNPEWTRGTPPPPPPPPRYDDREPITSGPVWDIVTEAPTPPPRSERPVWWGEASTPQPDVPEPAAGGDGPDAPEPAMREGPDDGEFTEYEWRRAVRVAEDMCAHYEALETRRVSAIPLLPSAAPVSLAVPACRPPSVPLVVGGQPVDIESHPHMAALGWPRVRARGYSWKCGGSLVSDRYVLTAAHCTYQDRDTTVQSGPPRVVQLGSARLDGPQALLVSVRAVVRHPRYRAPASYYDIALLELTSAVKFTSRVRPACVGEPPPAGKSIVATGWGRTEFGGDMSSELRGVSLPVWQTDQCGEALGTSRKLPRGPDPDAQMCAGELRGGKDTCQGDSGGPAVTGAGCSWRVVAVTSLGRACGAPRTPALYARALPAFVSAVVWPQGRE